MRQIERNVAQGHGADRDDRLPSAAVQLGTLDRQLEVLLNELTEVIDRFGEAGMDVSKIEGIMRHFGYLSKGA